MQQHPGQQPPGPPGAAPLRPAGGPPGAPPGQPQPRPFGAPPGQPQQRSPMMGVRPPMPGAGPVRPAIPGQPGQPPMSAPPGGRGGPVRPTPAGALPGSRGPAPPAAHPQQPPMPMPTGPNLGPPPGSNAAAPPPPAATQLPAAPAAPRLGAPPGAPAPVNPNPTPQSQPGQPPMQPPMQPPARLGAAPPGAHGPPSHAHPQPAQPAQPVWMGQPAGRGGRPAGGPPAAIHTGQPLRGAPTGPPPKSGAPAGAVHPPPPSAGLSGRPVPGKLPAMQGPSTPKSQADTFGAFDIVAVSDPNAQAPHLATMGDNESGVDGQAQYGDVMSPSTTGTVEQKLGIFQSVPDERLSCGTEFVKMTSNCMPNNSQLLSQWALPFGAIVRPLAPAAEEVPVVNFTKIGVIRCRRCRTYVNPFVIFQDGGRKWLCNLCRYVNDVPMDYFSPLDHNGLRHDHHQRPELNHGSVDFVAPSEYMVRPPQPPTYVFVIDVSAYAVQSGFLRTVAETIRSCLERIPGTERARVAFITVDSTLHFYNLRSTLLQPQMMVIPDIADIFLPLPEDLLVSLESSMPVIDTLLERLPTMFERQCDSSLALGAAIQAAQMLAGPIGGKIMLFMASLPTAGELGRLANRDQVQLYGTDDECKKLLQPADDWFRQVAVQCNRDQLSFDIFVAPPQENQFADLATVSVLPRMTAGELFHYNGFSTARPVLVKRLRADLTRVLTRPVGWEAVMRIRCSSGVKVTHYYGHSYLRGHDLLALPVVDEDKTFGVRFGFSSSTPVQSPTIFMQIAALYTTSAGERRIRVHTKCVPTTNAIGDLYRHSSAEATAALMTSVAIDNACGGGHSLAKVRENVTEHMLLAFTAYRKHAGHQCPNPSNLMLPRSLRLLPVYFNALLKSRPLRSEGPQDLRIDGRVYHQRRFSSVPLETLLRAVCPRLCALHDLPDDPGAVAVNAVPLLPNTVDVLNPAGVYLADAGYDELHVWIGQAVAPATLQRIFGVSQLPPPAQAHEAVLDIVADSSAATLIRSLRPHFAGVNDVPIAFHRQGVTNEQDWLRLLTDDGCLSAPAVTQYALQLHQNVMNKVATGK